MPNRGLPKTVRGVWALFASLAIALPTLIAYNVPPSATFLNQAAAFCGWGLFLLVLASAIPARTWPWANPSWALLGSLGLLVVAALSTPVWAAAPWSLSLSSVGAIASAMLAIVVAACATRAGLGERAFAAFCFAL